MKRNGIMAVVVMAATVASAVTWTEWQTHGSGDWFDGANWSAGVPTSADNHWVRNGGTANISSAGAVCFELNLGYNTAGGGTINVSSNGTLTIGSFTYIARDGDAADVSTLNITGGGDVTSANGVFVNYYVSGGGAVAEINVDGSGSTWTTAGTFDFGRYGSTTMNIKNGGAVTNSSSLMAKVNMAYFAGSDSTLNIASGGTFACTGTNGNFVVGQEGTGAVVVDGSGSFFTCFSNALIIANLGDGTFDVTAGATAASEKITRVGFRSGSTGVFSVSGTGSVFNANLLEIGWNDGGFGTLNISDGGLVTCETLFTATTNDINYGVVQIGGDGEFALLGDGSADIAAFLDLVEGGDNIEFWTGAVWANLTNATLGADVSLVYHAAGDLNGYTVLTVFAKELTIGDISITIEGTDAIVGWEGTFGTNYTLQSVTDLTTLPAWVDLQTNIPGFTGSMSATSTTTAAESFYRIIIE